MDENLKRSALLFAIRSLYDNLARFSSFGIKYSSKFLCIILFFCIIALIFGISGFFYTIDYLYLLVLIFKLIITISGLNQPIVVRSEEYELPLYTILVPLLHEKEIISQLFLSIRAIDYPSLDVKILLEEDDIETIEEVNCRNNGDFDVIIVPKCNPMTKAKACNYGLFFARGEYVTIYDAEDIPDPMQLRENVGIDCSQARLRIYNRTQNLLTRFFTLEYECLFGYMLPGLQNMKMPIPLGGTSNHIKTDILRKIGGWDPYNLAEDADLGFRLHYFGYNAKILDSITMEESVNSISAWMKQRSRWIKGYIQTYFVHICNISSIKSAITLNLFIGLPVLVFLIGPIAVMIYIICACNGVQIDHFVYDLSLFDLDLGYIITVISGMIAVMRNKWYSMIPLTFIFPLYWILHPFASYRAIYQLLKNPYYWDKTKHHGFLKK